MPRPTSSTQTAVTGIKVIAISWEGGASAGAIFELRAGPSTSFSSVGCCGTPVVPGLASASACFASSGCSLVVFGMLGGTATGDGGIPNFRNNPCPGTTPDNNGGLLLPAELTGFLFEQKIVYIRVELDDIEKTVVLAWIRGYRQRTGA